MTFFVWQNPHTLKFWIVDDKGRGSPEYSGPHNTKEEAERHLVSVNINDKRGNKRSERVPTK